MYSFKSYVATLQIALLSLCALCQAQPNNWTTTPFSPFSWPLAVKGPYFNSWYANGDLLSFSSPAFWPAWDDVRSLFRNNSKCSFPFLTTPQQTTWTCLVVVDDVPYRIMGTGLPTGPPNVTLANQIAVAFTATRTSFVLSAGPVSVNVTFLSPVTVFSSFQCIEFTPYILPSQTT